MGLLVKRRVTLDLARRGTQATVPFSLGDRCAYEVIFTLRDGSEQVALPPGTSAAVTVRNGAGGTGCVDGCVIDHVNNNVIYTPTVDALSVEGNIECTLHLFDGDGGVIGAPTFIFAVSEGDKADTEGEVSKALVANPGWGIIADTENKAKEAAEAAAAANNSASQASDEVAAAQMAAGEARAEADRAHDEAELSKMWANGGITLDEPPSEINNSYYWATVAAGERISAETQVGLAAAEVNKAKTEVQNAAAEVEKAKAEAQTAEAEAIKARMWAVGEKNTPGKTSPSDSNNAMYYSNKSRDYMNEAEKYTNMTLSLSVDREKHIYTVSLIRDGTVIGNPIEIDLPFEEVVVGGEYDDTSEELVLKLKDGGSVRIPVGDIISPDDVVRRQYPGSYDAVYTETSSGEVVLLPVKVYSGDEAANTLVKRGSLGEIRVRLNPEFDDEAVPKRHVDEVADAFGKAFADLKEWVTQNQPDPVEIVQNLGDSPTAVICQKGVTDAIDGLALKGSASGKVIRVDDVAPGEYPVKVIVTGVDDPSSVKVTVSNKNLFADTYTGVNAGITLSREGDYYVLNGATDGVPVFKSEVIYLPAGTYTLSAKNPENMGASNSMLCRVYSVNADGSVLKGAVLYFYNNANNLKATTTLPAGYYRMDVMARSTDGTYNNFKFQPQLELGSVETEYVRPAGASYTPNADESVSGALAATPSMIVYCDNDAAKLDVEYAKDITGEIDKIKTFPFAEYGLPVLYFTGDTTGMSKDVKVNLKYKYGDRSGNCTLKWQGSSSIYYPKKNYTVVFDNAFEAVEGWGAEKKYCLKADWIDASHLRNVTSAKIWAGAVRTRGGTDSRLLALPNCGAIDGFPCFVVINGEWMGIYNFNIPKEGWMFGMKDDTAKHAILCAGNHTSACRFRTEAVIDEDFDLEYNSEAFTAGEIQTSLNRLIRACINSDGSDLDTTIAQYVDINSAIDYYIFSVLLKGIDIVSKNYILATYDGTKWFFSAYDLDCVFGLYADGSRFLSPAYDEVDGSNVAFKNGRDTHKLFGLLYYYKRAELVARYKELRAGPFSVSAIMNKFYNGGSKIPRTAFDAEVDLWKTIPCNNGNDANHIVNWYQERVKATDAEVEALEATLPT